jgi:hypothetical protein
MSEEINKYRCRFLGTAAMTIAAAELARNANNNSGFRQSGALHRESENRTA